MNVTAHLFKINSTNCYLIHDTESGKAQLIDPALYDGKIADIISSKGISLEYIVLTHGHYDHILGANKFREETGAKIAAHELEKEYLENPGKSMTGGEIVLPDILLKENDILTSGDVSLGVIHTPGHTKGSCCFICGEAKAVFAGDTLFKDGVGRCDLYGGDYRALIKSLEKLKSLDKSYKLYPGHGESTTLEQRLR
ncbi:MAG: MBL fold metallo-hydrolase [Oscillospiraceae bacterium]|nr:MBL fold metallo-hydrolase [Oscillospiraceae bacterium]